MLENPEIMQIAGKLASSGSMEKAAPVSRSSF
jgi:hypothetical protein